MVKIGIEKAKEILKRYGYELEVSLEEAFEIRYMVKEDILNECNVDDLTDEEIKKVMQYFDENKEECISNVYNDYEDNMDYCSPYGECIRDEYNRILEECEIKGDM